MALFGFKKEKKEEKKTEGKAPRQVTVKSGNVAALSGAKTTVITSPRITEKVSALIELNNVYTFHVTSGATKKSIAETIQALYKVVPLKVRVASIPRKRVFVRGKRGVKSGGKKAYVYLKKGDKIQMS